jgi:hypothetical protein
MAKPKQFIERVLARFREGTIERIKPLLAEREAVADLIRDAVEREIQRRERELRKR